jgi:hypothetical protein
VSVQYRLTLPGKVPDVVEGPDDATVVVTVPAAEATSDPAVAFMQGKLKASGHTGQLLDLLRSGDAAAALTRLAATL